MRKKNSFYDDLEILYDSLLRNSVKIIMVDFNRQIEQESQYRLTIGQNSLHSLIDNGTRIINFATLKVLIVRNIYFPYKHV